MSVSTPSPAGRKKPTTEQQPAALSLLEIHQEGLLGKLVDHRKDCERHRHERIDLIRRAREAGLTYAQIGNALGITEAAVRFYVKRNGAGA